MHIPFLDQWGIILIIGLLIFGKRLPEVGKSLGKGIVEFKKGLQGIGDEVDQAGTVPPQRSAPVATQYKYDPITGQPLQPQLGNAVPPGAKFDPYTGKPLSESIPVESRV
jgi:TatA/E family protein of Tat protein translocase